MRFISRVLFLFMTCSLARAKPNVLFIAIDDLRTELGCYGAKHIVSPNIDKLAASGVRFERAYCQQALCGPSRASVMTGLRPDSTGVHSNHVHFRELKPDTVTLPQHFKNHGYHAQSMGKIYHGVFPPGSSRTVADTFGDALSWSVPTFRPGPRYYYTEEGIAAAKGVFDQIYRKGDWTQKLVFGLATEAPDIADSVLYDGQVADRAVTTLKEVAAMDKPFFLAIGFIKPHSPYIAPKKYWDLYDDKEIKLAHDQTFPQGAPSFAGHGSGELRRYTDQQKRGPIPKSDQRRLRHAYYACVSYIDAQVGKVLDELDRQGLADDTIVVLWADHGYHLGEKGLLGKTTNYELDARVPLIIRAPGRKGNGRASDALVELVDFYPTLADLAGLPVDRKLQGTSLAPLLDDPDRRGKRAAFTQFTRGKRRGYSIATPHYRYVEWYEIVSSKLLARELYDHREDPNESLNIAASRPEVARRLARLLERGEGWRDASPDPELTVAGIFGERMVLQRGKPVPVWGTAPAGKIVTVSFAGQEKTARANLDDLWKLDLAPVNPSAKGRKLTVAMDDRRIEFDDVLVGDVWLCSGQSNMRWTLKQSAEGAAAIREAANPKLRLIDFAGRVYPSAKRYTPADLRATSTERYFSTPGWQAANSGTAATFSAVAYYFGATLQRELGVPIGLMHNAIGGAPMEAFIPLPVLKSDPKLSSLLGDWLNDPAMPRWVRNRGRQNLADWIEKPVGLRPHHPFEPGFLFEAGMRPMTGMAITGFLWYQGESNATEDGANSPIIDPEINRHKFETLIASWRREWGDGTLPFYFAQLSAMDRDWAPFRDVQRMVAQEIDGVGMAVTLDLGDPHDVHPKRKKPVGKRLALQALAKTYGQTDIDPDGPRCVDQKEGEDNRVELTFDKAVYARIGNSPLGFAIAGEDQEFYPAEATIDGRKVILRSPKVKSPVAARYAWENVPDGDLVNAQGMPASPFRTDDFVLITTSTTLPEGTMSFEEAEADEIAGLTTPAGTWKAKPGHAAVNSKFAHSGRQSLHLRGGENRQIEFSPVKIEKSWDQLSFRAERWTKREPFAFRVEVFAGGEWREIYNGDRDIRVGARFLSLVKIPVPAKTERFRLRCTAHPDGGILIDDVRLREARPMMVSISQSWPVNPVLIGKNDNPVLRIHCLADGSFELKTVTAIEISMAGTDRLEDIRSVRMSIDGEPFGMPSIPDKTIIFRGERVLMDGENTFVVSMEPEDNASLDRHVRTLGTKVHLGGDARTLEGAHDEKTGLQRIGFALRQRGQDKSGAYRIPGLDTTNKGTLIAVYDNRYRGGQDLPGDIDVGMSRSADGGQTWEPMKVIMDMGDDPKWRYDGIGDPSVLVDRKTNTIWVAATWSHGNRSWHGSGPGIKPEETGQFMLVKSEDDGLTWSEPINITSQIKDPKWRFVLQGPGKGITLRDGTLVFPAQFRGANAAPISGKPFSTLIYSRDRGRSWTIGVGVKIDTTEAQLVQLSNGSIMINCRDNRGGSRSVYTTRDFGKTWQEHPTSRGALPEPVCMASLIRVKDAKRGNLLFFSNPPQVRGRHHMTIKVSADEGMSWPRKWHALIDERFSAYSCLTTVDEDKIGLLYEGPSELYFVRIPIKDLIP